MKALLLSAPSKASDEVNWTKPLNNYLLSVYGNTTEFQDDLARFTELRKSVQGAADNVKTVEFCLDYYSQLELLDLRVPLSSVNKRKPVKFTWYDAFAPEIEHTQTSVAFEKASVLFNLGSALMKAAASKYSDAHKTPSSSGADGEASFKEALQMMQQAAGVYTYLSESFLHSPSSDLKPATAKFLSNVCLAQSQEMFTLKVIDGDLAQTKNSLIAKLCASAANSYAECHADTAHLVNDDGSSALGDQPEFGIRESGIEDDILTLGDDQNDDELAEYDPEMSDSHTTKVSAQLNASWVAISNVAKSRAQNVYDLLDNLEYQRDALKIKLGDVTKDNDLIYHDIVPSIVTLAEPKAMNSAKVIPMNKIADFARINENNYNHFLANVVPVSIHELLSYYSEEKSQFLRNEIDAVDVSNEELSSALEFLNLPRALVSVKELILAEKPLEYGAQESLLDVESLGKVQEISSKFAQDTSNRNLIAQTRKKIVDSVGKSESLLNSASTNTSQGQFREDLIKLKRSLYEAANSDSRLFALIDQDNSAFYNTLGKGANSVEFKNLFSMPEIKNTATHSQEPEISLLDMDDAQLSKISVTIEDKIRRLEDILNELNVVKTNKANLIAELKKQIHDDDISDILLINSKVKSTNEIKTIIFPEELKKFESFSDSLNELIKKQNTLLGDVKSLWEELISSPKVKEIQSSSSFRNGLLNEQKSKIDGFYENNWKRYTVGLQRGIGIYQKLLEFAISLQNAIERQTQMGSFTQAIGSLDLGRDTTGGSIVSSSSQNASQYPPPTGPTKAQQSRSSGSYSSQGGQTFQPQLEQGNFFSAGSQSPFVATSFSSGSSAPQLPPKRPSHSSVSGNTGTFGGAAAHNPDKKQHPTPTANFGSGGRSNSSSSGLIYDQPSTYSPNMYDYFTPKRG
ncbi:hypothetical protein JCM33374_g5998 [Metschnikowia sp. JCM 33374]|nr:hypothetical protein JCM33374_g5998 [Metschnikowia sp. JCM 33374]